MSDNDLVEKDNVVQFPVTTAGEVKEVQKPLVPAEQIAEKAANSQEFVMRLIEKNRKKGLEQTQHKLENLTERKINPEPTTEEALRDVQGAVQGLLTWAEAANSLIDLLKHDLVAMITNLQQQGAQGWQTAAYLQTLITTMKEKNLVTEEELRSTWDKTIVPGAKAQLAQEEEPSTSPILIR